MMKLKKIDWKHLSPKRFYIPATTLALLITLVFVLMPVRKEKFSLHENSLLTVTVEEGAPGFFRLHGVRYGLLYELFNDYARSLGKQLKVIPCANRDEVTDRVKEGDATIGVICSARNFTFARRSAFRTLPVSDSASYLLVSDERRTVHHNEMDSGFFRGKRVLAAGGAQFLPEFGLMAEDPVFIGDLTPDSLAVLLKEGTADFIILQELNANIARFEQGAVVPVYRLRGRVRAVPFVLRHNKMLRDNFADWLKEYKTGKQYAALERKYNGNGFFSAYTRNGYVKPSSGISPYDEMMKRLTSGTRIDWELIAAIAYHESRFRANVSSGQGARGMMQIMPHVARSYGIDPDMLGLHEISVGLAVRHLIDNQKMLGLKGDPCSHDNIALTLASYNAGVGHVQDARKLAGKYGADPDKWDDVAVYLQKKAEEEYYQDSLVVSGRFSGKETIHYVEEVMNRYENYKQTERTK